MDLTILTENFTPLIVLGCLIVGYILKHSFEFIPNKYIPTILAVIGLMLNVADAGLTLESVIYGACMGLASTGMHQAFTRFISGEGNTE